MPPLIRKIEPGDSIGRCRIIRELGRGGVGTVYLATHQTLQVEVALKILSPALAMDNPALAERFIREAQLAARIRHPNVIAVMDSAHDEPSGLYFIVMEYVGGGSLSWHLRHGPLPEAKALGIISGIAQALVLAEENHIVHRDIKPDNILLDLRGTPKLADLGLAKHSIDSRTSITLGGSFMGTPAYMSPEQARDAKVADTRDDIYSLGATLYECLTGEPPFKGETPYNIMSELLTKPSPCASVLRPEISRAADLICRKMMAKSRDLRYRDARALVQDLTLCQSLGDSSLDRLEAASLEEDSREVLSQARSLGVQTSAEGVYVPGDSVVADTRPSVNAPSSLPGTAPSPVNRAEIRAAIYLILLVTGATALLLYLGPHASWSGLFAGAQTTHHPAPPSGPVVNAPPEPKPEPKPAPRALPVLPDSLPPDSQANAAPEMPLEPLLPPIAPLGPVVQPEAGTNSLIPGALPVVPVIPDSAFVARGVAEAALPKGLVGPTGHAPLLKVIGRRDNKPEPTPSTWVFYFYDPAATGNAVIVTVADRKVVKQGEDLVDALSPFHENNILAEDKLLTDSSQALEIAASLVPGVAISSSEFLLFKQEKSVPMWRVTLWTRKSASEEKKLGDATIVAENGFPISRNLKP